MEFPEKVNPSRGEWVSSNENRASAAFPGVSYAEQIQSSKRRLEMYLENKTSRSYRCPISTHLVGSSRRLCIWFVEAEDVEPVYALKLYRVEDQQIRNRDKQQQRIAEHHIKLRPYSGNPRSAFTWRGRRPVIWQNVAIKSMKRMRKR
jgi:hypothetical protein